MNAKTTTTTRTAPAKRVRVQPKKAVVKVDKKEDVEPVEKKVKEKKIKRICKWKKDRYSEKFEELSTMVAPVRFICLKCGRAASDAKFLCKPKKIGK